MTTEEPVRNRSFLEEVLLETVVGGCGHGYNYSANGNSTNNSSSNSDYMPEESSSSSSPYCPRTFDGWSCWNATPAGHTAYAPCPWFIAGFDPSRLAHKDCLEGGTWFRHPHSNLVWSNYTNCVDIQALHSFQTVTTVYEVGYLISLAALTTSLAIFCSFRSLACPRVSIHKHLFTSFIINNSLWIAWYTTVNNETIPVNTLNQPLCIGLHILVHYFLLANYFWMFCEGLYLHTLLVYAFTRAEKNLLRMFVAFGWAGPALPIALYTSFRATDPNILQHNDCWIDESPGWSHLFLSVPVCICLLLSLLFLLNILRVLLLKITNTSTTSSARRRRESSSVSENLSSLRKAFRATLILIPLLGLHYLIIPFRPQTNSNYFLTYQYVAAVSSSLQGLAVSVLFCFANNDVIKTVRRKLKNTQIWRDKNISRRNQSRRSRRKPSSSPINNTTMSLVVVMDTNRTTTTTTTLLQTDHADHDAAAEAADAPPPPEPTTVLV